MYPSQVIRRILCSNLHHWQWTWISRNRCQSLHHWFVTCVFFVGVKLGSLIRCVVCGPPRYAEIRINFSQAFNGIGTVVAPVLGSYVFFLKTADDPKALTNVQWVYLAIACFVFLLAVVFYLSPIPEITDADMQFQAEETHANTDVKPFRKQYRLFHAAFAQFCYTGAQVAIAGYFINYVTETRPNTDSSLGAKFLAGAQGAFALGRFIGVAIMKFARPRWVFLFYLTCCIIFIAPSITQRGNTGMSMLFITLFFESICFPTIVALGMRGLGKYSKRGSGFIVGGVAGGACVPPLLGAAADLNNSTAIAMSVPLAFFVGAWTYALAVNFVPKYREVTDKFSTTKVGLVEGQANDEERAAESSPELEGKREVEIMENAPASKELT
jgi:MFS transporter, FHS family, L-fucose permease